MDIKSEDVAEIIDVGELYGDKVKMIKTHGGLNVVVGKKDKNSKKPDALAAASHRALALHQIEKTYGSDFRPAIMKSESEQIPTVTEFPVSREMAKDHLQVYGLKKSDGVDFVVARFGMVLSTYSCNLVKNELELSGHARHPKASDVLSKNSEEISRSIQNAISNFVKSEGLGFKIK